MLKLVSVTQFVAILTAVGLLANCPVDRNLRGSPLSRGAGLRMNGGGQHDIVEANQCARRDCGCELASDYNPVCVEGKTLPTGNCRNWPNSFSSKATL